MQSLKERKRNLLIILNYFSSFVLQSPAGFTLVLIRYVTEMRHTLVIYDVQLDSKQHRSIYKYCICYCDDMTKRNLQEAGFVFVFGVL